MKAFELDTQDIVDHTKLVDRFSGHLKSIGIDHFAYGALYGADWAVLDDMAPAIALNYPESWVQEYFDRQLFENDPVVTQASLHNQLFTWDSLTTTEAEKQVLLLAREGGLPYGATLPLHGPGSCFVLSFATDNMDALHHENLSQLSVAGYRFHEQYLRLKQPVKSELLITGNALETLKWLAVGKSPDDIAEILNLSRHGVYWLIADAKKKLGVKTTAHLVAKALRLGILPL